MDETDTDCTGIILSVSCTCLGKEVPDEPMGNIKWMEDGKGMASTMNSMIYGVLTVKDNNTHRSTSSQGGERADLVSTSCWLQELLG